MTAAEADLTSRTKLSAARDRASTTRWSTALRRPARCATSRCSTRPTTSAISCGAVRHRRGDSRVGAERESRRRPHAPAVVAAGDRSTGQRQSAASRDARAERAPQSTGRVQQAARTRCRSRHGSRAHDVLEHARAARLLLAQRRCDSGADGAQLLVAPRRSTKRLRASANRIGSRRAADARSCATCARTPATAACTCRRIDSPNTT